MWNKYNINNAFSFTCLERRDFFYNSQQVWNIVLDYIAFNHDWDYHSVN